MDIYVFSMVGLEKHIVNVVLSLIVIIQLPLLEAADECPLDFNLAPTSGTEKYCYSLKKDPEQFSDKFVSCDGNLFTYEMYTNLKLPKLKGHSLWTDYKSLYPGGGPFVDWSYTSLNNTDEINRDDDVSVGDELCVVIDPVKNFSMVRCDARHYRYCVVEAGSGTHELKHVKLTVTIDSGEIKLTVDQKLDVKEIMCFTDSSGYYPERLSPEIVSSGTSDVYSIQPSENGYYWCTHSDTKNFYISESNKALYVETYSLVLKYVYAVKLISADPYLLNDASVNKLMDDTWYNNLREYVYYTNEYIKSNEGAYNYTDILNFRNEHPGLHWEDKNIVQNKKLKRLYLDAKTALLHVELHPDMKPVKPGQWESIVIEYMRPVYYCDKEKKFSLGMNFSTPECKLYKCMGDYNDGVQTIITPQDGCYLETVKTATAVDVVDVTPLMPTIPPLREIPDITYTTSEPWPHDRSYYSSSPEKKHFSITSANVTDPEVTTVTESTYKESTMSNKVLTATSPLRPPPLTSPRPPPSPEPTTTESTNQPTTETTLPPTRPPPEDTLALVITNSEKLLNNTDPFMFQDIQEVFTQVDKILVLQEELTHKTNITGYLLHLLDDIGARIDLNGLNDSFTVRENIALLVADAQPQAPVRGLRVAVRETDTFTNETFEIIREFNSTQLSTDENEVVVYLPDSVSSSSRRISFVVFRNDRAFQGGHEHYTVNSRVLSINVENLTEFSPGEVIDIHMMPLTHQLERNQSRSCAFWQFNDDNTGNWSQEGCTFIRASRAGLLDTCRCDHLTHFAEILVPRTVFSEQNETALEILSIIGCCVSILGLLLIGLTAALFRSWRRDYNNKIWLQLCISILILSICFLVVVFAQFQENKIMCLLTGVALHYSVLSSFCWMLVAAVLAYRRLVLVFSQDASHKLLRASAFAWGAPCAVVGILLSVTPDPYALQYEDKFPSGAFCYPSGLALWLAVYAPITLMLLTNWTLFVLIVRSVFGTRQSQNHGHSGTNEAFRCASVSCLLVFLFGLPWLFGNFSFNVVCAYFFTILVTFQGFVLFFCFVLGNKKTRVLWLNKWNSTHLK